MLPRAHRLRRSEDFRLAVRRGVRVGRDNVVVHMTREGGLEPARAGLVVSKSVGNAVNRNLAKRRLRSILRPLVTQEPDGTVIVVRALPSIASVSFDRLERQVGRALVDASRKLDARRGNELAART